MATTLSVEEYNKKRFEIDCTVESMVKSFLKSAEAAITKYMDGLAKNPWHTVEWYTEAYTKALYVKNNLDEVVDGVKNNVFTYEKFVNNIVDVAKRSFEAGLWHKSSTSVMANEMNTWKHQVYQDFITHFGRMVKKYKELGEVELPV